MELWHWLGFSWNICMDPSLLSSVSSQDCVSLVKEGEPAKSTLSNWLRNKIKWTICKVIELIKLIEVEKVTEGIIHYK